MEVKFKTVKTFGGWAARFTIGVQSFTLADTDTKKQAQWYCDQLKTAFKNLLRMHITNQLDDILKEIKDVNDEK